MANILNILDKNTGEYVSVPAIQGASAYDVAVENGFEGTEKEWLESLKGEGADIDMSEYATISYVDQAVENLDIDGSDINLDGFATEEWTKEYINENIETISNGYYESTSLKGEDITDDIIELNGELPTLPTYTGGTKYIINGGVTNVLVNPKTDEATLYINDYQSMDSTQRLEMIETLEGNAIDYFVYGAYNKDLLTKTDMMEPAKTLINRYRNLNTTSQYFPNSDDYTGGARFCSWSFYGKPSLENDQWINLHINGGTISQSVAQQMEKLEVEEGRVVGAKYSDGSPGNSGQNYRKQPCVYMPVKPYTTYTINYTGDTDGDQNYMRGLHYCLLRDIPSGGGCSDGETLKVMPHTRHSLGIYTETFTTGSDAKYLCLFVGRLRNTNASFSGVGITATLTSASASYLDTEIIAYNVNNLSVVEGAKTYEYYIDMIRDIDFELSITAMSIADESTYSYFTIKMPYIMKSNQYFRFDRNKDIFTVSRPLVKAVGMQIDEMENTALNYELNKTGVIGKWIDGKDIYRTVLRLTLPKTAISGDGHINTTTATLQDVVDTLVDVRIMPTHEQNTLSRKCFGSSYHHWTTNSNYMILNISAWANTYLPVDDDPERFYSNLYIRYGNSMDHEYIFVLDYTTYNYMEDGTVE